MQVKNDICYFSSRSAAEAYAIGVGFPRDRIIEYQLGFAVQLAVSGPYVGPHTTREDYENMKPGLYGFMALPR